MMYVYFCDAYKPLSWYHFIGIQFWYIIRRIDECQISNVLTAFQMEVSCFPNTSNLVSLGQPLTSDVLVPVYHYSCHGLNSGGFCIRRCKILIKIASHEKYSLWGKYVTQIISIITMWIWKRKEERRHNILSDRTCMKVFMQNLSNITPPNWAERQTYLRTVLSLVFTWE